MTTTNDTPTGGEAADAVRAAYERLASATEQALEVLAASDVEECVRARIAAAPPTDRPTLRELGQVRSGFGGGGIYGGPGVYGSDNDRPSP
jgi:PHP family Zn ribbon phosphoesterase